MAASSRLEGTDEGRQIPFIDLEAQRVRLGPELDAAIKQVLEHGRFIMGPEVTELEDRLRAFSGAQHCITCASGTDALSLVLMAEDIGPGDAVFVPSFTFVATAGTVAMRQATPVFVDVEDETFNMDPDSLSRAVAHAKTEGLRPRMIIAVDLFGQPADYAALTAIAGREDLVLVADAAQSFGAQYGNRRVGTLADYTTTSFFPAKPLGCYGDGGAIFTEGKEQAALLRSLRMHGQGKNKYDNQRIGLNSRLDTLQAAILIEKLKVFPQEIEDRNRAAKSYRDGLICAARHPMPAAGRTSVWAQYTLVLPENLDRETLRKRCRARGVPSAVYYPTPLHLQPALKGSLGDPEGLAVSEDLANRVLSLPMHAYLDDETQARIVTVASDAIRALS